VLTPPGPRTVGAAGRVLAERLRSMSTTPIVTVGDAAHVSALEGWSGDVLVKLASSMRRFGVTPRELDELERKVRAAGLSVAGHSIHLPLAGDDGDRLAEVDQWVDVLARRTRSAGAEAALWVSHHGPDAHAELRSRWRQWRFPMRIGTALWHGDKAALRLSADVLDVHTVAGGSVGGYRGTRVVRDGTLVVIGAGTAHGVTVLDDGRSPFHFQRRRLALLESPHMHTSMAFVPTGEPCPVIGDTVDVQRPLISVNVDEVIWA
jgi:alanine racemase